MRLVDYFKDTRSVAKYPREAAFYYPVLGLAGEWGELEGAMFSDDDGPPEGVDSIVDPNYREHQIMKEAGDVLWYCVNTYRDALEVSQNMDKINALDVVDEFTLGVFGLRLPSMTFAEFEALRGYHLLKQATHLPITSAAIGRLAEIAKKFIRDGGRSSDYIHERMDEITLNVAHVMYGLFDTFTSTYSKHEDLTAIAELNIKKLFSRRDRGVLQGDGDNR